MPFWLGTSGDSIRCPHESLAPQHSTYSPAPVSLYHVAPAVLCVSPPHPPVPLTFRVVRRSRFALGLALLHAGRLQALHAVAGRLPGVSQALDGPSLLAKAALRRALPGNRTAWSCGGHRGFNNAGGKRSRPGLRRCIGCWRKSSHPSPAAAGTSPVRLSAEAPLPKKLGLNVRDSARGSPSSPKSPAFPRPPVARCHPAARGVLEGREDCQHHPTAGTGLGCGRWTSSGPACGWPSPPTSAAHGSHSPAAPPDNHGGPSSDFCGAPLAPGDSMGQLCTRATIPMAS